MYTPVTTSDTRPSRVESATAASRDIRRSREIAGSPGSESAAPTRVKGAKIVVTARYPPRPAVPTRATRIKTAPKAADPEDNALRAEPSGKGPDLQPPPSDPGPQPPGNAARLADAEKRPDGSAEGPAGDERPGAVDLPGNRRDECHCDQPGGVVRRGRPRSTVPKENRSPEVLDQEHRQPRGDDQQSATDVAPADDARDRGTDGRRRRRRARSTANISSVTCFLRPEGRWLDTVTIGWVTRARAEAERHQVRAEGDGDDSQPTGSERPGGQHRQPEVRRGREALGDEAPGEGCGLPVVLALRRAVLAGRRVGHGRRLGRGFMHKAHAAFLPARARPARGRRAFGRPPPPEYRSIAHSRSSWARAGVHGSKRLRVITSARASTSRSSARRPYSPSLSGIAPLFVPMIRQPLSIASLITRAPCSSQPGIR